MPPSNAREPQRIAKLLARAGVASRRDVERMIAEGRIALNGTVLDTPATLLTSLHGVTVDGQPVAAPAPARLFRFHKPAGVLTTERDPAGRPTIYDRLPAGLPRLVPVGRLDLNTEGLLLMTTDGELKRQLELPASGVERTYRARAYGEITQAQLEELMLGVEIEGVRYGSINANLERRTGANVWIELTLTEGKNREVRRVLEHLGLKVSRLIRTRYGPFHLGDLETAAVDEVRQHDLVTFRKTLAGPGGGAAASQLQLTGRRRAAPEPAAPAGAAEPANRAQRRSAAAKAGAGDKSRTSRSAVTPAKPSGPRKPAAGAPAARAPDRGKARPSRDGDKQREPASPAPACAGGAAKPKFVPAATAEEADRSAFAERPKRRYRPTDRRPRRPAGPKR